MVCRLFSGILGAFLLILPVFSPLCAETIEVDIPYGSNPDRIAKILYSQKVITNPQIFTLMVKLSGNAGKLKSGLYEFNTVEREMDILHMQQVMSLLIAGVGIQVKVTIPEGYSKKEIFSLLRASGLLNGAEYEKHDRSPELLKKIRRAVPEAKGTEGFYFPDTYTFPKKASEIRVLNIMVDNFISKTSGIFAVRSKMNDLSVYETLILASIIEKETGALKERNKISSVFHNRLARGIPLATDPTVIYGVKNFDGNLRKIHLQTHTPFNTYKIKGLPPTPISSPGLDAIDAALNPEDTPYLYFVAKGDGTSYFSVSLNEHEQAVRKYQLGAKTDYRSY